MLLDPTLPIRDLALGVAGARAVFEANHIDYSCVGGRSLLEACAAHGVSVDRVLADLASSADPHRLDPDAEWLVRPLAELTAFLVRTHHEYTRAELARIRPDLEKVVRTHGANRPELFEVRRLVSELEASLLPHLRAEERVLFPHIERLEAEARGGRRFAHDRSIATPVHAAMSDHGREDTILSSLCAATREYALPDWGCSSYRLLFDGLQALAADLHRHFHLENNVLFPRAVELARG